MAKKVKSVKAVERNRDLSAALTYNANGLQINNITAIHGDCEELLPTLKADAAFIDPARRAGDGSRVYGFEDCEPNIVSLLPIISSNFNKLILKASPMIDIAHASEVIIKVSEIHVIGTTTECKELILISDFSKADISEPVIHSVTIFPDGKYIDFTFTRTEENSGDSLMSDKLPQKGDVLYLPYPAIMKAGPVKLLSSRFGLFKFHYNTHLYFSNKETLSENFPGEKFEILEIIPWQSKHLKRFKSKYPRIAITVRNFGISASDLSSKLGVKEGGTENLRLFGIGLGKNHTDRLLIVCRPMD